MASPYARCTPAAPSTPSALTYTPTLQGAIVAASRRHVAAWRSSSAGSCPLGADVVLEPRAAMRERRRPRVDVRDGTAVRDEARRPHVRLGVGEERLERRVGQLLDVVALGVAPEPVRRADVRLPLQVEVADRRDASGLCVAERRRAARPSGAASSGGPTQTNPSVSGPPARTSAKKVARLGASSDAASHDRSASRPRAGSRSTSATSACVPTSCSLRSNRVTTPKLPPPPRSPQNRSGFSSARRADELAVRRHHLVPERVVAGQPELPTEPPDAPTERQPADPRVRHDPRRRRQPERLRRRVQRPEQRPALHLRRPFCLRRRRPPASATGRSSARRPAPPTPPHCARHPAHRAADRAPARP